MDQAIGVPERWREERSGVSASMGEYTNCSDPSSRSLHHAASKPGIHNPRPQQFRESK